MNRALVAALILLSLRTAWADVDHSFHGFGAVLPPAGLPSPGMLAPGPSGSLPGLPSWPGFGSYYGVAPGSLGGWGSLSLPQALGSLRSLEGALGSPSIDPQTGFPTMEGLGFDPGLLSQGIFDILGGFGGGAGDLQGTLNWLGPMASQMWGMPMQTPQGAPLDPGLLAIQGLMGYGQALNDLLSEP